jgi:hypothetical protein
LEIIDEKQKFFDMGDAGGPVAMLNGVCGRFGRKLERFPALHGDWAV